jgi:regulator of protease activity HflC (stomatin/prohibitin superfamily)
MLFIKYLLLVASLGFFILAAGLMAWDVYAHDRTRRMLARGVENPPRPGPLRWKTAARFAALAWLPLLLSLSIVVVPSGMAGVRVSQISGTHPGTLYPGVHFVKPLLDRVVLFDIRDQEFSTNAAPAPGAKAEVMTVQAREGLPIGLAVTVRYRLDPQRLDYVENNLPQPVEGEIVAPTVATVFREIVPAYTVRDVFAAHREEIREHASEILTRKLGADAIVVKEVMVRDVQLPEEYAKGLEGLLLKEQENDRMGVETEIQQKQVAIAELQAEAQKVREVKRAEGEAQVRVLQAKGESDAMQYTLPLKEKQIQQTKLEAEARKESVLKGAEASAEAKVIDSKAELQRRNLLAEAEANRIHVTSIANAERMRLEAVVLKQNPLLINKIIAEKLSDKVQIMMVPSDGKFFLTNDLLRGAPITPAETSDPDDPPETTPRRAPGSH